MPNKNVHKRGTTHLYILIRHSSTINSGFTDLLQIIQMFSTNISLVPWLLSFENKGNDNNRNNTKQVIAEKRLWHRSNYHLDKKCLVNYVVALGCATSLLNYYKDDTDLRWFRWKLRFSKYVLFARWLRKLVRDLVKLKWKNARRKILYIITNTEIPKGVIDH